MDFGKVDSEHLGRIDFRLPADDSRHQLTPHQDSRGPTLHALAPLRKPRIGIGCPVWAAKTWLGLVYPSDAASGDLLYHYSRAFNSIELNSTHYRIPDLATVARWREKTPEGFRFCPKFPQEISHRRPIFAHTSLIAEFVNNTMELGERLGLSFLQLPPGFAPMDLPDLRRFLRALPSEFPIAVEVRHPGFFEDHQLAAPLFDLLRDADAHAVITDVAGRRDVLHASLPGAKVMVRFIGNDLHPTDDTRLAAWSERVAAWLKQGLDEIEFFVHEPNDNAQAPEGVARFTRLLNAATGLELPIWTQVDEPPRESQLSFF